MDERTTKLRESFEQGEEIQTDAMEQKESEILSSATKLVLLGFALVLTLSLFLIVIMNLSNKEVIMKILSLFETSVTMVLAFYFGQKSIEK